MNHLLCMRRSSSSFTLCTRNFRKPLGRTFRVRLSDPAQKKQKHRNTLSKPKTIVNKNNYTKKGEKRWGWANHMWVLCFHGPAQPRRHQEYRTPAPKVPPHTIVKKNVKKKEKKERGGGQSTRIFWCHGLAKPHQHVFRRPFYTCPLCTLFATSHT